MKSNVLIIVLSFLLLSTTQSKAQYMVYEDEAVNNVYSWYTDGNYEFQVLGKNVPQDLKDIITKYRKAVTKGKVWFDKYKEDNKGVSPLPYDKKFGITEQEYDRLNNEYPNLPASVVSEKDIIVTKNNGYIRFKGDGDFKFLDLIYIDKNAGRLLIDSMSTTKFEGQVYEDSSALGSYSGYKWKYERGDLKAVKALQSSNYYSVEVIMAKTVPDNKTLVIVKVLLIERMVTRFRNEISGYLVEE